MGDANQHIYLKHWLPRVDGPILEVGSKDYGSTDDKLALRVEAGKQQRKYLPYLMLNMLGTRGAPAA